MIIMKAVYDLIVSVAYFELLYVTYPSSPQTVYMKMRGKPKCLAVRYILVEMLNGAQCQKYTRRLREGVVKPLKPLEARLPLIS
jgi:hypothetical protein